MASVKFNGNSPTDYDRSFIPSVSVGWNLAQEQVFFATYRFLGADVGETFNAGVPDLESTFKQRIRLNMVDIMYRETLGGEGMPLGMSFDVGTRFAWAYMNTWENASTIAGPLYDHREQNFYVGGGRLGVRPYWMFDQSAWQMTVFGEASFSYLWGQFREQGVYSPQSIGRSNTSSKDWDTMWNVDLEAGFSMYVPGCEGVLKLIGGYRYEIWAADRFNFVNDGSDKLTVHGPFLRIQFSF